ncbi:MAG: endolytic transglycosylase MltG [Desulfobulbaceae bacterium]|nr:endolytic transglycosylase MltG [Desulfobulbaceae bacterium]
MEFDEKLVPRRWGRRAGRGLARKLVLLLLVGVIGLAASLYLYAVTPSGDGVAGSRTIVVPSGSGLTGIQRVLADEQLIDDDLRFRLLARILGVGQRLKAGEYQVDLPVTPYQLLLLLESGKTVRWSVTIPEGASLRGVADGLAACDWLNREEFLRLTTDKAFIHGELGLAVDSLEGYLFPDTYHLSRNLDEREVIEMMVARLREVLNKLGVGEHGQAAQGMALHRLLTLASIVEKETAVASERPLIARVFLNRLAKGMRLQTDPTVIYGLSNFNGNLTKKDLLRPTPYNTYVISGLPPGPIANPGRDAIAAVLYPAEGPCLYFVSRNDGTHHFSVNLEEHNTAVAKYQKRPRRR